MESSKYKVPKKVGKNESLKACLFKGDEKTNFRSKTSLSFSEQMKKYEDNPETDAVEEDWSQSMGKAFIPSAKFRKERRQSRHNTSNHY